MKIFFAGSEPKKYRKILFENGAENVLVSAYTLGYKNFDETLYAFKSVLVDSGGFTIRTKNLPFNIQTYVDYINKNNIKLAFNLDTNDLEESLENQRILETKTKAKILPVYHLSDFVNPKNRDIIDEYVKKYDYISTGGMAGVPHSKELLLKFLSFVFSKTRDKVKVHGLGITSQKILLKYPFYSCDSTSWQSMMRYGSSAVNKNKKVLKFKAKTLHYLENTEDEIKHWVNLQNKITALWLKRGISWKD